MIIEVSVLTVTLYVEAKDILYGIIEKIAPKEVVFSDFIATFAMSVGFYTFV